MLGSYKQTSVQNAKINFEQAAAWSNDDCILHCQF